MTLDKAVRVLNQRSMVAIALSRNCSNSALIHPNGRILQSGSKVEIVTYDGMKTNNYVWVKQRNNNNLQLLEINGRLLSSVAMLRCGTKASVLLANLVLWSILWTRLVRAPPLIPSLISQRTTLWLCFMSAWRLLEKYCKTLKSISKLFSL